MHEAAQLIDGRRFNVMVARVMELVNSTRKAIDTGCGPADPAVREAVEAVAVLLSLVAPYTAEEMWERLGHQPTVARAGWPAVDPALLVQDAVTCVVQIQGKVRARLEVSPDVSDADLEAAGAGRPGRRTALWTAARCARSSCGRRSWSTSSPADTAPPRPTGNLRPCRRSWSSPTPRPRCRRSVAAERGIVVVPLQVVIGADVYDEGADGATPETVAEALREFRPVSTSRPAPAVMLEVYEQAARDGATRWSRSTCPAR